MHLTEELLLNYNSGSHPNGAKVFGAYKVVSLNETSVPSAGQPSTTTQFDGINVTLVMLLAAQKQEAVFNVQLDP